MQTGTAPARTEGKVTWATVNPDNDKEWDDFIRREGLKAGERIKDAVKRLQDLGIIDAQGNLVNAELPPDMQSDSECVLR